jgi:hypothetical protein
VIHFTCPKCGKALNAPDRGAGRSGRCTCGASFIIPYPESAPPPREVEYEHEPDDEPASDYRPRRRRGPSATVVVAVVVSFALGALAGGGLVWLSAGRIKTQDSGAGGAPITVGFTPLDSWTHKELAEHLKKKGIDVLPNHFAPLGDANTIAAYFNDRDSQTSVIVFLCADRRAGGSRVRGWAIRTGRAEP